MKLTLPKQLFLILSIIVGLAFLFTSYIPNIYEAKTVKLLPPDRKMIVGEHMYTYDYNVYLSKIRQGMEGRWTVVDNYDNNPESSGVFLQMLYLLSGKIGGIFALSPGLTFHLLRTVASIAWVITIIFLSFYFLKKPLLAFIGVLLSLFAASWPVFYTYQGTTWVGMFMSWWQELDVLKRISYIPHYTVNYIITAVFAVFLVAYAKKSDRKIFLAICFLLFFSFFIHPSAGLLFLISWTLFHVINFFGFKAYSKNRVIFIAYHSVLLFLIVAIPLLYFQYVTSDYPWKSLIDFDKLYRYPVNVKDYILALGPVFFTGILGALLVLWKKDSRLLSLVTWFAGAFLAILAFKKFPFQSELRFVQTVNHVPLAILSVYLFSQILLFCRERFKTVPYFFIKFIIIITVIIVISIGLVQSYFSIKAQTDFIHQRIVAALPLVPYPPQVMYPLKDLYEIMSWLDKKTKNEEVVLSHIYTGNYIPAYSGNFVYLGHNPETPHYEERVKKLELFYSGTLSSADAKKFLKEERISYVVYGPQEWEKSTNGIKQYSFLTPIFSLSYATLYKVQ
ncbi:hypothetical protein HYW87_03645 [Candidatus Roizmanbacteria bacterium]|nr:hypothetical protein [Candidatus Roizmanbacteria bacterium]